MKFIHAADIHLDSPLIGLQRYDGAPVEALRGATRRAFQALVDLALAESVDFLLIAGDLYDGDWRDFNTGLFFVQQATRLTRAGIPIFLIHGNHDAESRISRRLTLPETVKMFSAARPETARLPELGVAIHGQSFRRPDVTDNLARDYPAPIPGWFNIGLLHTAATGREGHAPYAPCDPRDLVAMGYDYWALGHIHRREILNEHPHIVFPGNLQGRHARETEPKGCTLVQVEDGRIRAVEHRTMDVLRWAAVEADLTGADTLPALLAAVRAALEPAVAAAQGRPLAARLRLTGRTRLHAALAARDDEILNEIRALAQGLGPDAAWIEKIVPATRPLADLQALRARPDALGALLRSLDGAGDGEAGEDAGDDGAAEGLDALLDRLPAELRGAEDIAALAGPAGRAGLAGEARALLLARLLDGAEDS